MAELTIHQCIDMTVAELGRLFDLHDHVRVAFSGGKDSGTLVTLAAWAIETGKVRRPRTLALDQSDTLQELAPLVHASEAIRRQCEEMGWAVNIVSPEQDKGLWVNVLGRGVVPPNSMTARWCTRQLKQDPMARLLKEQAGGEKPLMLVGLRTGESATRDRSMAVACSRDGGECGQGRFYFDTPDELAARAAPIVHWKTCKVWAWLKNYAPQHQYGEWPTELIADAYGGAGESEEEAGKKGVRTGCIGCPLVPEDRALTSLIARPEWSYLAPLAELSAVWVWLRRPENRLRKRGYEVGEDGRITLTERQRGGPIRLASRLEALERVLSIQSRVNDHARRLRRPEQWVIPAHDETRIRELVAANTWPRGWAGTEPGMDEPMHEVRKDGSIQLNLFA